MCVPELLAQGKTPGQVVWGSKRLVSVGSKMPLAVRFRLSLTTLPGPTSGRNPPVWQHRGRASPPTGPVASALILCELTATRDGTNGGRCLPDTPEAGGDRTDGRFRVVSDALPDETDCLRFDYGPFGRWGRPTERQTALGWARREYDRVGLFGFSFDTAVSLAAMAGRSPATEPAAVSAFTPARARPGVCPHRRCFCR